MTFATPNSHPLQDAFYARYNPPATFTKIMAVLLSLFLLIVASVLVALSWETTSEQQPTHDNGNHRLEAPARHDNAPS